MSNLEDSVFENKAAANQVRWIFRFMWMNILYFVKYVCGVSQLIRIYKFENLNDLNER